jgi:2,3-cyclic nucleotide 3-phosphodiesterase
MGSGKSTFIKNNNLTDYTLSADEIRLMFHSPSMTEDGSMSISARSDREVWNTLHRMLEVRMMCGDFTVIDATHKTSKAVSKYLELADKYRYNCYQLNIEATLEECLERNLLRDPIRRVPDSEIIRAHEILQANKISNRFKQISSIDEIINYYVTDVSDYKEVKIIGDVHGCYTCLKEAVGETLNPEVLYVFVGDYFDRGIENKEMYDFLVRHHKDSNVILLEGNHEKHIWKLINGLDITSSDFKETLEEIEKSYPRDQVVKNLKEIYNRLRQCFAFVYKGQKYLVTHGGLTAVPSLTTIPTINMIKGVGGYDMEVDKIYEENYLLGRCQDFIQVHGHRNTDPTEHSICLEDSVEFGGNLKVLSITEGDRELLSFENKVFSEERLNNFQQAVYKVDDPEVCKMMNSRLVNVKGCKHNMYSLNFTRNAFIGKKWNLATIKARGLFVDKKTGEVRMRSYDKFFNLGEQKETRVENLEKSLVFPVKVAVKENGYLGIMSVVDGQVVFASKTTDSGPFAERFERIFNETVSKHDSDSLKSLLKKENASAVFEVISPTEDPHIIKYEKEEVVLLDILHNKLNLEPDYQTVSDKFKEVVKKNTSIRTPNEFTIHDDDTLWDTIALYSVDNCEIEGFVVTDARGFKFKVKFDYYNFVKSLRRIMQVYRKCKRDGIEFNNRICKDGVQRMFVKFLDKYDDGNKSIIDLYEEFEKLGDDEQ